MIALCHSPRPVDPVARERAAAELPRVSVVLPIRNEAAHIEACLERLLEQDYPRDRVEILVVDGRSDDRTREVVGQVQARRPEADLRLLDNPQRTVPHALNLGIRAARGDVIVRMDGHAVPTPDYLSACVAALTRSGAANVGGVIVARGTTPFGEAVALATQHPLGAGDAKHWIGGAPGDADTVPFGAFRRTVFERVGLFDESLVRNQDYEFNVRLRAAGERIHFDPAIRFAYTPRGSVRALWSQYLQYGWWKVETLRRHPHSLRWRQAVPPAFMLGLVLALLAAPWSTVAAAALVAALTAYLTTIGVAAWRVARPPASAGQVLLAFVIVHFGFSLGFLLNLASRGTFPYRARQPQVPRYVPGAAHETSVEVTP
jgi:glycosyltransferase involved in cell wall biosynthesis